MFWFFFSFLFCSSKDACTCLHATNTTDNTWSAARERREGGRAMSSKDTCVSLLTGGDLTRVVTCASGEARWRRVRMCVRRDASCEVYTLTSDRRFKDRYVWKYQREVKVSRKKENV